MVQSPTLQHANDNMHRAFRAVCTTLQLTKAGEPATELVAIKVLEIAGLGVADAEEIATRALEYFQDPWGLIRRPSGRAVTPAAPAVTSRQRRPYGSPWGLGSRPAPRLLHGTRGLCSALVDGRGRHMAPEEPALR